LAPALPRRILIVAPNWIGDALMAAPLIKRLKSASDGTEITVMAPPQVAAVLRLLPDVTKVIATPWPHGGLQLVSRVAFGLRLAEEKFDAAYVLPNSFKSALVPLIARIPVRIGYVGEGRRYLLTRWLANVKSRVPMRTHYLALAATNAPDEETGPVRLVQSESEVSAVATRFGIDRGRPIAAFCPGAEYGPAKRWPVEHFAALARLLHERDQEVQIVLVGGPNDVDIGSALTRMTVRPVISTIGKTTIEDAVAILKAADIVISNDSGLMHVAAALDRPQIALFGSTDPSHTPPQSTRATLLWLHLSCSPCFERTCPLGHLRCLNEITPESVMAAIDRGPVH